MADQVRLFGTWCSPFSTRVIWALKLKGIPYDYIEEDLPYKKSAQLLKYNPVHKKIPVLVHGEKPICESMVIVEYIEETWPQNPLLPSDPYERAMVRFWIKFAEDTAPAIWMVFRTTGEEQEKAKKESLEMLRTIEEHAGLDKKRFFGGDNIGIVDIAFGQIARWYGVIEEVVGVELLEPHAFPRIHALAKSFKDVPAIKENLPDHDRMVASSLSQSEKACWLLPDRPCIATGKTFMCCLNLHQFLERRDRWNKYPPLIEFNPNGDHLLHV